MARIKSIIDNKRYKLMNLKPSNFYYYGGRNVADVYVPAGHGLRAGLVYNSCSDGETRNELVADFDLWISNVPKMKLPGTTSSVPSTCYSGRGSVSSVNEFEMVMQDCLRDSSAGNTFRIAVHKKWGTGFSTCNGASYEPVYVAWDVVRLEKSKPPSISIGSFGTIGGAKLP